MSLRAETLEINYKVSELLQEIANLLEQQDASIYRVNAYRHAADTVRQLKTSLKTIVEKKGFDGLVELPNIGEGIARSIYEYVATERMTRLESLRGEIDPEALLCTVPGIGPQLAERIHQQLNIGTLEALEEAAHSGRLSSVPGLGSRKIAAISASLEKILGRPKKKPLVVSHEPDVATLLGVDANYRAAVAKNKLPLIAPKRFNPNNEAWLPIMHATKNHWHFTVLFSNTARAHELGKTRDWVVIYFYDESHQESQCTVVTETHGPLINKRVIRGRELECREYYESA